MKKILLYLSVSLIFAPVIVAQNQVHVNSTNTVQPAKAWNEDDMESLMALWDKAFADLQHQKGASTAEFNSFLGFNKQIIEKENGAFYTGVQSDIITQYTVDAYISSKMIEMNALYDKFLTVKKEFPTSTEEYNRPAKVTANICSSDCSNIGFEDGNLTGWYAYYGINNSVTFRNITGITGGLAGAVQKAAQDPNTGNTYQVHITSGGETDWFLNTYSTYTMSQVSPFGGNYSCMVGDSINAGKGTAILEQTYNVSALNPNLSLQFSVFTELPPHTYWEQPFFQIFFLDQNGDTIRNCGLYQLIAPNPDSAYSSLHKLGFKGIYYPTRGDSIYWKDWTLVNVNLSAYAGTCVTVGFEVGDCEPSAHCAWAYVDATCSPNKVISSSPAICGQDTITLTAPPGFVSYKWTGPAGGIVGSSTNQTVTVDSAGTYCVDLIPITGKSCADTICINITKLAGPAPHPTFTFTQTGCSGDTVCFTNTSHPDSAQGGKFYWDFLGISNYQDSTANPCFVYHVPGTYTVKLHEVYNGCGADTFVTITILPVKTSAFIIKNTSECSDSGSAAVNPCGGIKPYTYSWSDGKTTDTIIGLSAGTYTVTVRDSLGNSTTASVTITQAPALVVTTSVTAASCNNNTGTATATVTGGTSPYTYSWNPSGQTTATATGLSAGTYTVTVKDKNGCSQTATATITSVSSPTITVSSQTNEKCNDGTNGSGTVTVTGGTTPYTYLWNPGGGTNPTESGLSAGTYTITVTDANGCNATTTITITQPTPITTVMSDSAAICGKNNGTATVTVSGGTGPYTYLWNPGGGTTATITGLSAGTYTVTVTDHNGCTETNTVNVTINSGIDLGVSSQTNPKCDGNADGSATISATGGTLPYTYLWTPGGYTTATVSGLSAATYTVTVTDNKGCNNTIAVIITAPPVLIAPLSTLRDISCNGLDNGTAAVTASGGTPAYTYLWTPPGNTTNSITGLSAGTYTIQVTDANGCTLTSSIIISQPPAISTTFSSTPANCSSNDGTATVTVSGGTSPYTYYWSPSAETTATATGLSSGSYTVTVTDYNGCNKIDTVVVKNSSSLAIVASNTNELCNGGSTATANVTATGGTSPYTYLWNPGGGTTASISNLSAGIYTITVTDNSGCTQSTTITVTQPAPIALTTSSTATGCSNNIGSATVSASGGTSPYTYSWNPGSGTTATISGLSAGTYTITVTDNNGCTQTATATVSQPSGITVTTTTTSAGCANNTGTATATASGGAMPYTYLWSPGSGTTATISGLGSGTYTVAVTDANGCTGSAIATVTNVGGVTGTLSSTNIACFGGNTGSATVTITSGVVPYTYLWTPGSQTTATASGLSAGSYTISVLDSNGCSFTGTVNITGPASALAETHVITNASCNSTNNGSIALTVTGGTQQYTFLWSNSSTTQNLSNILPGSYTVAIKDSNGCTFIDSMKVGFDSSVFANAGKDTILCHNSTIVLNGNGSISATSYQWYQMPGMTKLGNDTSIVMVTPSNDTTTYVLIVHNGSCSDTSNITVVLAPAITANAGPDQIIVGTGTVTIGGSPTGPGGSTYFWSPSVTLNDSLIANPAATPSVTTIYTVLVRNTAGCTASDTVTVFVESGVTVPNGFSPNADGTNDTWVLPFAGEFPNIVVEVYNRWGELLFQSTGYNVPWDGTYNGKALPVGTYYYIVKLNDPRYPHALTGPLTIMR